MILINMRHESVVMFKEDLVGVITKFICENPFSHSLEEMEIEFIDSVSGTRLSGNSFQLTYSRNPAIKTLYWCLNLAASFFYQTIILIN